ncbi:MAG: C40 family peptidase [Oscillospiraceae bacterium]|nr:C40 family peptidase [Oscillospiraceae bacterium]
MKRCWMVRGLNKEPHLQFTEEERIDPVLKKPIRKAEQAAKKADKEQAKIPKKTVKTKETTVDTTTGKKTVKLKFEEVDKKKPPAKLSHAARDAPGVMASAKLHQKVRETEQDNVGVESAHKTEEAAETGARLVREGYRSHQLKPYRKAAQAEHRLEKANVNALYQKSLQDNPQLASNPVSRWQQKQAIKKQYAAAKRAGQSAGTSAASAAQTTGRAAEAVAEKSRQAAAFIGRHKKGFLVAIILLLLTAMLMGGLSSCSVLFESTVSSLVSTSYPSRDEDMLGAEAAYAAKEADLQYEVDHYETLNPGYDEYRYKLDDIKHDPYVLVSLLTAYFEGEWTLSQAQAFLSEVFDRQYTLTENVVVETRYRTETDSWTDEDGTSHTDTYEVPYDYYICNVKLENFDLSHLPVYLLNEDKLGLYAGYMATLGNSPDLFPTEQYPNAVGNKPFTDYDVPPEALADATFAAMIKEAEKYLGYPYVWGGASPSASFDCSGFVSWVINHSGWNVGRLTANGLLNISTPVSSANAKHGDLIFFQGTYNTTGASHVGIYVGNGMMIHCGDPISYTSINTNYWQAHFYTFARLP